jgi:hypothetical protein
MFTFGPALLLVLILLLIGAFKNGEYENEYE